MRSVRLEFLASPDEAERYRVAAERRGVSVARWVRSALSRVAELEASLEWLEERESISKEER